MNKPRKKPVASCKFCKSKKLKFIINETAGNDEEFRVLASINYCESCGRITAFSLV